MSDERTSPSAGAKRRRPAFLFAGLAALLLALGGGYWAGTHLHFHGDEAGGEEAGDQYTCGMHPWIISDKPGDCPICGMTLTKIEKTGPGGAPTAAKTDAAEDFFAEESEPRTILFYRNPMNPAITSSVPAKDEMGMDYIPVYSDAKSDGVPPGYSVVWAMPESVKLAGVRTETAVLGAALRTVRTVGTVVPDETRVRRVQTKIGGWVENLRINYTGQKVRAGEPVLSLYSPELLASQEEFLLARETAAKFAASDDPATRETGKKLLDAARKRLKLFDVPDAFVARLEETGQVSRTVTLDAPVSGFVTEKAVLEGQRVEPQMMLYTVTDLSRVWIEVDLYEYEAGVVRVGQKAELTLPFAPGETLSGKVTFVDPVLAMDSRTVRARLEFPNPKLGLKPGMFADVTLPVEGGSGVTIPDSAILDSGVRQVVFVETGAETYTPREVTVGVRGGGVAQILDGVREGEKVVVKANFLLDSESRLRAALTRAAE